MKVLVKMLFNSKKETYHPIIYLEHSFPGEGDQNIIKYKSKGHRTIGFKDRQEAIDTIEPEITSKLIELGCIIEEELEDNLQWDGIEIPINIQLRKQCGSGKEIKNQKTHKVIDMVYHEDEGNGVFVGTHQKCIDWVSKQGMGYKVIPLTLEEFKYYKNHERV
jgi:hypothetical protein